jgi:hypothetical protein
VPGFKGKMNAQPRRALDPLALAAEENAFPVIIERGQAERPKDRTALGCHKHEMVLAIEHKKKQSFAEYL